ncbi:MAG: hypothetical protein HRU15_04215 [Planctomycetes bacterium]|nr:hypothetical protein [Planctomycetota bacterium]
MKSMQQIQTVWDDLLNNIDNIEQWSEKREHIRKDFLSLLRDEAAPEKPTDNDLQVEKEWDDGGFSIQYVSYFVEADERAHAYIAIPDSAVPEGGFPAVVCLHGTTNWGARRTLGLQPDADDPHADRWPAGAAGMDYARQLALQGFVCISPEHFCCATRMPKDFPQVKAFDTGDFYKKHPQWSAVGKYVYDSSIATTVLAERADVDAARIGVTGHSLGAQGSIWLAAYDQRIQVCAPSCAAMTFRENADVISWSRDQWYIYFPQLREQILTGEEIGPDFHEMMALIAPRPLLERFSLDDCDAHCQNHRVMLHLKLRELYRLYDAEQAHTFLVMGDGHSIPDISQQSMLAWMERWLQADGNSLGVQEFQECPGPVIGRDDR